MSDAYRKLYLDKQDELLKVAKKAMRNLEIIEELKKVCFALDEFQKEYERRTFDKMPGNKFYSAKLMVIVDQARASQHCLHGNSAICPNYQGVGDDKCLECKHAPINQPPSA